MATLIKRFDSGSEQFFSLDVGRDYGSPLGGWIADKNNALQFNRKKDAENFLEKLLSYAAPFCEVEDV